MHGIRILKAVSSNVRLGILNILFDKGPLSYTELMSLLKMDPSRDAGRFAYHLRFLLKAGLLEVDAESKKYALTDVGRLVVGVAEEIEKQSVKTKQPLVRTSRYSLEEFDVNKITLDLNREAGLPIELGQKIAKEAEKRLLRAKVRYLTAPLIREVVNAILIENGLEDYRHKLTRLGLPVYDVHLLVAKRGYRSVEEAGKSVLEEYMLLNVLPRDVADAHLSGKLHIHDLSCWILKPSEVIHDVRPFLADGLKLENIGADRHSLPPPKSFEAALNLISNAVAFASEEVSRGQTLEFFNVFLAPFLRGLDADRARSALKLFILNLSLYPRISINLEFSIPAFLSEKKVLGSQMEHACFGDYGEESLLLASMLLEAYAELAQDKPLLNPSITIKLRPESLSSPQCEAVLIKAHQLAAGKAGICFASLVAEDAAYSTYSPSGCRLSAEADGDWETDTMRVSILGNVTINMPRICYESEGDGETFQRMLEERLDMALRALELKYRWLRSRAKSMIPFLAHNVNGDQYLHTSASACIVNLAGLREAAEAMMGKGLYDDERVQEFAVETLKFISEHLANYSRRRERRVYPSALPFPKGPSRLAQIDVEHYGVSKVHFSGSRKQPYYSTSSNIPPKKDEKQLKMLMVEKEIGKHLLGGSIVRIPLDEANITSEELLSMTRTLVETHQIRFFTYGWRATYCIQCGKSWAAPLNKCPSCGGITSLTPFAWQH